VCPFLSHTDHRSKPLNTSYHFSQILQLPDPPKACTILLRGPSKDILNEIDRNLADAMSVACNVVFNRMLVPGGWCGRDGHLSWPARVHGRWLALRWGPSVLSRMRWRRRLVQNAGENAIRALTVIHVHVFCFLSIPSFSL
jgi:hypothetical protein